MAKKKTVAPKGSAKMRAATIRNNQVYNEAMAANATFSRSSLSRQLDNGDDPRRDIDEDCGFPKQGQLTPEKYREMYDRMPIARRVVEVMPRETWKVQPLIQEDDDLDKKTPFEEALIELPRRLSGATSWRKSEGGGNVIWEYLLRLDMQAGIGDYGVLLYGFRDGKPLSEPVDFIPEGKTITEAILPLDFLRVFDQINATIHKYVDDNKDPRFGQPESYDLTFNNVDSRDARSQSTRTEVVHWTRCLHYADNITTSEIIGTPRQQVVYNNLLSLRKLYGGSGEMYWRGAFPGLSIETHPELGGDVIFDEEATKEEIEQYMNSLQRYITTKGMHVNSLDTQVVDPTPQIKVQLEAIAILLGMPLRILMGSERGELSSNQDKGTWNDQLRVRESLNTTPRLVEPFHDRLIQVGSLPTPESYMVTWPDRDSPSALEQAEIAVMETKALSEYTIGGVEALVPAMEFLVGVMHYDRKRSEAIIKGAIEQEELLTGGDDDDDTEGQANGNVGSET